MASPMHAEESHRDAKLQEAKKDLHPLDTGRSAAVDIPNNRSRKKSILISSPREDKHTRRKSVQISLSPVECPSIQSKSWQPAETPLADTPHRRRRDTRSRSKSVNQVQPSNLHFPDQHSNSLIAVNLDSNKFNAEKSRRRRRSRSGSKSFHSEDQDGESPALNSLQEIISSLKQIPPSKGHSDHFNQLSPHPTTSPSTFDFLRNADLNSGDTIISRHVSQSPTPHEPTFPNSKTWNSGGEEDYRHGGLMGTSQGFTYSYPHRMNSYGSYGRKWSYSSR
ncbi:hypothetical protein BGW37DRAFT_303101 [Umbelopsis sp. PMI_123]|nr:hypothetical protein BGW37DRAFT_303101 [Umbelopsis sp. PMI_123]